MGGQKTRKVLMYMHSIKHLSPAREVLICRQIKNFENIYILMCLMWVFLELTELSLSEHTDISSSLDNMM